MKEELRTHRSPTTNHETRVLQTCVVLLDHPSFLVSKKGFDITTLKKAIQKPANPAGLDSHSSDTVRKVVDAGIKLKFWKIATEGKYALTEKAHKTLETYGPRKLTKFSKIGHVESDGMTWDAL